MDISDFSDEDFLLSDGNIQVKSAKTIVQTHDGSSCFTKSNEKIKN